MLIIPYKLSCNCSQTLITGEFTAVHRLVGRYFDILIYRDIFNRDYCIEGRNLSDDISKLSSCSMTISRLLSIKIISIPRIYSF